MDRAVDLPGLGGSLAWSLVSLGLVCVVAYGALRLLSRRLGTPRGGPIRVLARCAVEPRRSLALVEVAGRCLLVGIGDGPMTLLAELSDGERAVALAQTAGGDGAPSRFSEVLARALGRGRPPVPRPHPTSPNAGDAREGRS
jgi:flagellar biosynthetic protein FliO